VYYLFLCKNLFSDKLNSVVFSEPDFIYQEALLPYQPLAMKVILFSFTIIAYFMKNNCFIYM